VLGHNYDCSTLILILILTSAHC